MPPALAIPSIPHCGRSAVPSTACAPPRPTHIPLLPSELPKVGSAAWLGSRPARWRRSLPKASLLQECRQLEASPLLGPRLLLGDACHLWDIGTQQK